MVQHAELRPLRQSALVGWLRSLVVGSVSRSEPIDLIEQRFNFLPRRFRWRGGVRLVRQVVRVWDRAGRHEPRRYFEVVCHDGASYVLFQDLNVGTWHIS